jgi:GNAT superfamily N-acetyltransferase
MVSIRCACPKDSEVLTALAVRSEGHWGFDATFLETFRQVYAITADFLAQHPTFVAESEGSVAGFYSLALKENHAFLEYLYVDPAHIGKGLGLFLWNHLAAYCQEHQLTEVQLICGPEPKPFYQKLGAVDVETLESKLQAGRKVFRMACRIESAP